MQHNEEQIFRALDGFQVELPSWGFANTGTRFGKFVQAAAATGVDEKLSDAGQVHRVTGCCPTVAVHVLWDFEDGLQSVPGVLRAAERYGVRIGAINPNLFQEQEYKYGSLGNPAPEVRAQAERHIRESIAIAAATGSRDVSLWFADGSNYPGQANIRQRRQWFLDGLQRAYGDLTGDQRLLIEYKPFEPAFYHTDVADWGMALNLAQHTGPQAKVLVDTGHHYQSQNVEQIVAWLLAEGRLGGFHFNDRRYADDDLTLGSIDPYQVFRIFHEIRFYEWEAGTRADVAYMVDQSHNLKPKIEAMIQTVTTAQELYAKAVLVDHGRLARLQERSEVVDAEECLREAFFTDVRPLLRAWREERGLPEEPLRALRESGYVEEITEVRREKNLSAAGAAYAN